MNEREVNGFKSRKCEEVFSFVDIVVRFVQFGGKVIGVKVTSDFHLNIPQAVYRNNIVD